jgi:hypothetical protein
MSTYYIYKFGQQKLSIIWQLKGDEPNKWMDEKKEPKILPLYY